jgi:hypothetical protein
MWSVYFVETWLNLGIICSLNVGWVKRFGEKWWKNVLLSSFFLAGMRLWEKVWRLGREKVSLVLCANWLGVLLFTVFGNIETLENLAIEWVLKYRFYNIFVGRWALGV